MPTLKLVCLVTRATIEVNHIFSEVPPFRSLRHDRHIVNCMLGYDADMMTVEYCRGFQ